MDCDIHLSHEEAKKNHPLWNYCPFCGAELNNPSVKEILDELKNRPIREGFTPKELSRDIPMPEPKKRWHWER